MKKFKVDYTPKAIKSLKKMDNSARKNIYDWINKNLVDCENPRLHGKALQGDRDNEWRYRVGDYRLIADIQDERILILLLDIDHRSQVYR